MTLLFYPDAGDWVDRIRLGDGFSLTEAAESGVFAMSRVTVDDPDADITIVGHHAFRALETACSWQTLFRGYFADRTIKRGDSLRTGAARVWDCSVADANATLYFEVIRGNEAKRPAETDTERLAWLLGSNFKGPISSDDTDVLGYDVDLDKADYRGQTMADVLSDCATASKANYWAQWDDPSGEYRLHYYRPTRAYNSSTLRISNVLSDVDQLTTYAPSSDAQMQRDPSRIFSGVYYGYGEKDSYVFEESASVLAAIGHRRETAESDQAVRTATKATAKAERYLEEADTDLDTVTVTLRNVPPSRVNLIRAGQRIQIRMTHLPGLSSFAWMRITRRTVEQDGENQLGYRLTLELADPKQLGKKRGKAVEVEPENVLGPPVAFTRHAAESAVERDDTQGGLPDSFGFGVSPPADTRVASYCGLFTPYIFVGCPFGQPGYSGVDTVEQWLEVTGTPSADAVYLRVTYTIGTIQGVAATGTLQYGIAHAVPTGPFQYDVLGTCPVADGHFDIPVSQLTGTDYLVLGPVWGAGSLENQCDGTWGGGAPVDVGVGNSGAVAISTFALNEVQFSGETGTTPWLPMTGAINDLNRTFALTNWNGKGVPSVRIGAVPLAYGPDYSIDPDTGEIDLTSAPWEGADLLARWRV